MGADPINGPMGGVMAPADELLAFAALHIDEGRTAAGVDLLPRQPPPTCSACAGTPLPGESQALGWTVRPWGDHTSLGLDATRSASGPCSGSCRRGGSRRA